MATSKLNALCRALLLASTFAALAACSGVIDLCPTGGSEAASAIDRAVSDQPMAASFVAEYSVWRESTPVVVLLKGANASSDAAAAEVSAPVIDRLGPRPVLLQTPEVPRPAGAKALRDKLHADDSVAFVSVGNAAGAGSLDTAGLPRLAPGVVVVTASDGAYQLAKVAAAVPFGQVDPVASAMNGNMQSARCDCLAHSVV